MNSSLLSPKPSLAVYKLLSLGILLLQLLVIACIQPFGNYGVMCAVSLGQLVLFVVIALLSPCRQPFFIVFLIASWIFNCGQIVCIATGHDDVLNLDFRLYGSPLTAEEAFRFYLYSQTLIAAGAVSFQRSKISVRHRINDFDGRERKISIILILTGLPFWLFVNLAQLSGAANEGYLGVYSLVIPAPIQALSFFFEAGLILLLLNIGRTGKGSALFWSVLALKMALMSTGSRQYAVCFLAVWCLLYFFYLRKLSFCRGIAIAAAAVVLLFVVDAFGELRIEGFSIEAFAAYLSSTSFLDVVWESLGEFGCAFSTLVASMSYVPMGLAYGMGKSYIAGVLSIIPTLVGNFPQLKEATLFITSIPGTAFFGGSMLGEFYYNFGWAGLLGPFFVGAFVSWCQNHLNQKDGRSGQISVWAASVISMFLLLFIRGYFADAMMKVAFVFLFVWLINSALTFYSVRRRAAVEKG